jgi:hypothetical protein
MGVFFFTFRKSESIQLHCIAKLAKSYSFLAFAFWEYKTSFALFFVDFDEWRVGSDQISEQVR